ncbi:MAG: methyltransferase domain-containing protein [Pseudomonadota bacterium]
MHPNEPNRPDQPLPHDHPHHPDCHHQAHHRPPSPPPAPGEPWSDALVDWYLANYAEHPTNQIAVDEAVLSGFETVLDVGCGGGAAVRAAASLLTTGKVLGIDPSPAMVRIAEETADSHPAAGRMAFALGSAETLQVADASVDVAMAINSLHHWVDIPKGLGHIARVLRPSGRFVVVEEVFEQREMGLTPETIRSALVDAGFTVDGPAEKSFESGRALIFIARLEGTK